MDLGSVGGLVLAVAVMVATVFLEGGSLAGLWGPSALMLIVGGTVGATLMSHPFGDALHLPKMILRAFKPPKQDPAPVAEALVALADRARRQGLLSLQDEPASRSHPLVDRGVTMVVDGLSGETIREALENAVDVEEERELARAAMLDTAGGYAPTIGIIGTVFGLINVLSNLADTESLGHNIAVAFLATFYGIGMANLFWLPFGSKLKHQIAEGRRLSEMVILGISSLQAGEHPRTLQEKLAVYVPAKGKGKGKKVVNAAESGGATASKEVQA